jgi:hypothetical protein
MAHSAADPGPAPVPPQAVAAATLSFVCVLPALLLAAVVVTLTGSDGPNAAQAWTAVPLAAAVGLVVGGRRLLRRRGAAVLIAANAPLALAGVLQVGALLVERIWAGAGPLLLLLLPGAAIVLAITTPVRRWLATGPRRAHLLQPTLS